MNINHEQVPSHRRTKIVATLGPGSRDPEMIKQLIKAGVNVFRLNFSHGSHEEHLENLLRVRKAAEDLDAYVGVLQDLSGPKIRITDIENGFTEVADSSTIVLMKGNGLTTSEVIYTEAVDPGKILEAGQVIFLSDGIIKLRAIAPEGDGYKCEIVKGGRLRAKAGIAFPDSNLTLPATTEKDMVDFEFGLTHKVDFVAISFVNNAADVIRLKESFEDRKSRPKIIAKIERKSALDNIDEIIEVADGLMVARGDLGLELPLERIPFVQRALIQKANKLGKPAIVATQMMHSMINSVRPTRAEVSDITAAVLAGTDAVMLSEETAIGKHPIEAVEYVARVAEAADNWMLAEKTSHPMHDMDTESLPDAVAFAACAAARKIEAKAIVACTHGGTSARLVGKYRPSVPVYGASYRDRALRRLSLHWGIIPLRVEKQVGDRFEEIGEAIEKLLKESGLKTGDRVVITGGYTHQPGATRVMEILEI